MRTQIGSSTHNKGYMVLMRYVRDVPEVGDADAGVSDRFNEDELGSLVN